jgi:putative MFS transporter
MNAPTTMIDTLDSRPLDKRYGGMFTVVLIVGAAELFDFYIISFVLTVIAKPWGLTFGESSIVLMAAGVGAVVGAVPFGWLSDRIGRKPMLLAAILLAAVGTGGMALIPEGAWPLLAVLRFFVGIGVAGGLSTSLPLLLELTPARHRVRMGSLSQVAIPLGALVASLVASAWGTVLGWRGMALLGLLPTLLALLVGVLVPESPRFLLGRGRIDEARRAIAGLCGIPVGDVPSTVPPTEQPTTIRLADVVRDDGRNLWLILIVWLGATTAAYGVTLWGPTILAFTLGVSAGQAALFMMVVILAGVTGRFAAAFIALRFGRRSTQLAFCGAATAGLAFAGIWHSSFIGAVSIFWVVLVITAFFSDGQFANLAPYTNELFPTAVRGTVYGVAESVNGLGKILGPLLLALVAGTSNAISPQATKDAVEPAFIMLAVTFAVALIAAVGLRRSAPAPRPAAVEPLPRPAGEVA